LKFSFSLFFIRGIFQLETIAGLSFLEDLQPFTIFFLHFDSMSPNNKWIVLKIMESVLQKEFLLPFELKAFCSLIQPAKKRPSTQIIVAQQILRLLLPPQKPISSQKLTTNLADFQENQRHINSEQLRQANLVNILAEWIFVDLLPYLTGPPKVVKASDSQPDLSTKSAKIWKDTTFAFRLRKDLDELKLCVHLLKNPLTSSSFLLPFSFSSEPTQIEEQIEQVLYGMAITILILAIHTLMHSVENQRIFREK
jgi:hypothetical protein